MSSPNPYEASQFSGQLNAGAHGGGVTPTVISHLSKTKPWVQLIGILAIIGAVMMVVVALMMMAGGGIMTASMQQSGGAALPAGMFGLMGGMYLLIGIVYLWLGIKLIGYGSAIGSLRTSGSLQDLERALDHQRSFWKTVGIMTLIGIVVFVITMIGAVIVGATMATKMQQEINAKPSRESGVLPDMPHDPSSAEENKFVLPGPSSAEENK